MAHPASARKPPHATTIRSIPDDSCPRTRSPGVRTISSTPDLPTVTLDATLADLYRRASPKNAHKHIAQVTCPVNSAVQLSVNIPRNTKYLYQDSAFNEVSGEHGPNTSSAESERELAMKYIALVPQRDAFLSGDTAVVLFTIDESQDQKVHCRREAERTFSVLPEKQRPNLVFCSGPAELPVKEKRIDLIVCKLVHDGLEGYDLLVPPETLWLINTKEALANSGLPTPRCDMIEVDGCGGEAHLCCAVCQGEADSFLIPAKCAGLRGKWFTEQSLKIYRALSAHSLPFVFKNQQAYGGAGTYLIRTEADRDKLLRDLQGGILRRLLSSITHTNKHLRPATILLSDLVDDPIGNYGLSFFVSDDDSELIFLAVTEQILHEGRVWLGSTIEYSCQDELRRKFGKLVKDMASWLRSYNYVGPVGVDVLETAATDKNSRMEHCEHGPVDELANFHVVDLNARTSGQLCLPLLRTHFTSRGLDSASSFFIRVWKKREAFVRAFQEDFETGRICILSWYEDPESDMSLGNVAVGAEDLNRLKEDMQRIRGVSEEVTF
ncbi:hypothetical protein DL770_007345 [Monosporascus sp. CRB-9-2]|nr:hypothetical protein DL770_007345 [Monosporascus sp. CRB-9-2]